MGIPGASAPTVAMSIAGLPSLSEYWYAGFVLQKKGRNKLVLLGSNDGLNWEELLVLENEQSGEFSYPAIIQAKDGTVHLSYTFNREKIKYIHLGL